MFRILFITLLLNLSLTLFSAENYSTDFGRPTQFEMDMKYYPSDKEADAVVLYDIGKAWYRQSSNGFELMFTRKKKIKIFKSSALGYANVEIPLYKTKTELEVLEDIKAVSYNLEDQGLIKKTLDKSEVYEESINKHWFMKKFAIPNVKEGTIIEYEYTVESPFASHLPDWEFQEDIPVKMSQYIVRLIPFYQYNYFMQGAAKFDEHKHYEDRVGMKERFGSVEYNDYVHEFTMYDIPAFADEGFMTSRNDFIIKLDFQLAKINYPDGTVRNIKTTWPELSKSLLESPSFGKFMNSSQKQANKVIPTLQLDSKTPEQKLEKIVNYVKDSYSWNGFNGVYTYAQPKEFFKQKSGNIANINLFLAGMLRAAELDAYPVLISTRDHGLVRFDFPFLDAFNYVGVVAYINGNPVMVDASEYLLPYYMIPSKCFNGEGFIVKKKTIEWASLRNEFSSDRQNSFEIEVNSSGDSAIFNTTLIASRYEATSYREIIENSTSSAQEYFENRGHTILNEPDMRNYDSRSKPFIIGYKGAMALDILGEKILVPPFMDTQIKENPFKQKTRLYPVDMLYLKKNKYFSKIKIPEGYKLSSMPEDKTINVDLFEFKYTSSISNGYINISAEYSFKKVVNEAKDYSKIKFYYMELVKKLNEDVVFEKVD